MALFGEGDLEFLALEATEADGGDGGPTHLDPVGPHTLGFRHSNDGAAAEVCA